MANLRSGLIINRMSERGRRPPGPQAEKKANTLNSGGNIFILICSSHKKLWVGKAAGKGEVGCYTVVYFILNYINTT